MRPLYRLVPAVSLLLVSPVHAGSVSGHFTLDGAKIEATEVAAFRIRDSFNPRQKQTFVMLTRAPVDAAAIAKDFDPYAVAINDPAANDDHVTFFVGKDGKVTMNAKVGGTQYIDSSGEIMRQPGGLVAECPENTLTRVACTVKSKEPKKDGEEGWWVDMTFAADVLSRPEGKPMPKDGGAPAKAMAALAKAVEGTDLAAILALVTEDVGADFQRDYNTPEENLSWAKEMLTMRLPKKAKVTGGEQIADDHVLLEVEGQPWGDSKMLYHVEMRQVGGTWRFAGSTTVGMLRD